MIPDLFTNLPVLRDLLRTDTSEKQDGTIQECLPYLKNIEPSFAYNDRGVPHLDRKRHAEFLRKSLNTLPAAYVGADASRPWFLYWALNGLATLGEDVSEFRERVVSTTRPIQNASGGFGGSNGQTSHLAPTYAVVLSLAIVGGEEALDLIDRRSTWKWLGSLKTPNGGFQMAVGGEVDIRGAYCALVIIILLNLPVDLPQDSPARSRGHTTLFSGLLDWISRCQTFEGGISGCHDAEAHGAYAFLALASLSMLGEPHLTIPKYLDVPSLTSWLSSRQYAPEGGLSGRTNKLVDGCYSHWVGSCFPLLEAALNGPSMPSVPDGTTSSWSLYNREGLIRYILCCCQNPKGGLRDKPSHRPDSYHTCYVLAGLSSAQHKWHFRSPATETATGAASGVSLSALQWTSERIVGASQIYDDEDRVATLHPVFAIPDGVAERTMAYYACKGRF